jgi:hypothetical protein
LPAAYPVQSLRFIGKVESMVKEPAAPQEFADIHAGFILEGQAGGIDAGARILPEGEVG